MKSLQRTFIATIAFVAALAMPAFAEIVYTPVNVTINKDTHYHIDLNGDGITDFTIRNGDGKVFCYGGGSFYFDKLVVSHATGNKVVTANGGAAALAEGVEVGPNQMFSGKGLMAYYATGHVEEGICVAQQRWSGNWVFVDSAYLGLEFQINGETHYGWVASSGGLSPTVTGFAYETVPNQSIVTGQTSGP